MSVPLSAASSRRLAASRFGAEFRKAMETRGISLKAVERASGISHTNLWTFKSGNNLPRLETALRMAEALEWPKLADLIREARSAVCARPRCGRTFFNEGGSPKRYCSQDCLRLATIMANKEPTAGARLLATVRGELARVHGTPHAMHRKVLKRAAEQYARSDSKRGRRVESVQQRLDVARVAVDAFCRSCEPDGYCQTPECELRPVSPLPLVTEAREVRQAVKADGPWGNEQNRQNQLVALRAAAERRWTPEERAAWRAKMRERHARLTPAEKQQWIDRISATKQARRAAAS